MKEEAEVKRKKRNSLYGENCPSKFPSMGRIALFSFPVWGKCSLKPRPKDENVLKFCMVVVVV